MTKKKTKTKTKNYVKKIDANNATKIQTINYWKIIGVALT